MIWLKVKKLEIEISQDKLTENQWFYYFIASIIYGICYSFYISINSYKHPPQTMYYIAALIISTLGVVKIFQINKKIDSKDFLKRYFAITWVIRVKLIILYLIFFLIYLNLFCRLPLF